MSNPQDYRQQLIDEGISRGYNNSRVNDLLEYYGYPRDYKENVFLKNVARNAGEFARDMRTFGGMVIRPSVTVANKVIKAPIGQKQKAYVQGLKEQWDDPTVRNMYTYAGAGALAGLPFELPGAVTGGVLGATVGLASDGTPGLEGIKKGSRNIINAFLSTYNTSIDDLN